MESSRSLEAMPRSLVVIHQYFETKEGKFSAGDLTRALVNAIEKHLIYTDFTVEDVKRYEVNMVYPQALAPFWEKIYELAKEFASTNATEVVAKKMDKIWDRAERSYPRSYLCDLDGNRYMYKLHKNGEWTITTHNQY